jgi:hypothetical protein
MSYSELLEAIVTFCEKFFQDQGLGNILVAAPDSNKTLEINYGTTRYNSH